MDETLICVSPRRLLQCCIPYLCLKLDSVCKISKKKKWSVPIAFLCHLWILSGFDTQTSIAKASHSPIHTHQGSNASTSFVT